jgi:aspartyl/asparaginyl beta-hydroxylase (cupin superfamily)
MLNPRQQDRHPMQRSAKWIMPGISRKPWHDPYAYAEMAPIIAALESKHAIIKEEFTRVWGAFSSSFGDYEHYLVTRKDWKALYVFRKGRLVQQTAALVPITYGIVDELALRTGKLCPLLESHFSTLLPSATIPPHSDLWNFSINLHFAIDIPPNCSIRVAGEERTWQEGKCMLFDYSFVHEAYNRSDRPRTCLLLDLWHPEVTPPERKALTILITEIRKLMGEA